MNVTAQDVERMLEERSGSRPESTTARSPQPTETEAAGSTETENSKEEEEAGYSLVGVSQKMTQFLNAKSSYLGAELPW